MEDILRAFDLRVRELDDLRWRVRDLLRQLLVDRGIRVHSVEARVKERSSLARKAEKHEPPYVSLREITDILGARIITHFSDDVDVVGRLIEEEFAVDHVHSRDPRASIDASHFGYLSLHYVVALSPAREALPEWAPLAGWQFEIQIRTILQHAWAEIEHDRGFHTASDVPADVRRRWSRVAALLELADSEFVELRDVAAKGAVVGQERPSTRTTHEALDAISSVAVSSAGLIHPGLFTAYSLFISIVLTEPGTIKRTIRLVIESPDVSFKGTPILTSRMTRVARMESGDRVIAVDLIGETGTTTSRSPEPWLGCRPRRSSRPDSGEHRCRWRRPPTDRPTRDHRSANWHLRVRRPLSAPRGGRRQSGGRAHRHHGGRQGDIHVWRHPPVALGRHVQCQRARWSF